MLFRFSLLLLSFLGLFLLAPASRAEFDPAKLEVLSVGGERPFSSGDTVGRMIPHPDGKRLITCSEDATVRVWNIEDGTELLRLKHSDSVYALSLHEDGRHLLSGGADKKISLWDLEAADKPLRTFDLVDRVFDVDFRPGHPEFVSRDTEHTLVLRNFQTGKTLRTIKGHKKDIYASRFITPDHIFGGCDGGESIIWDISKPGKLGTNKFNVGTSDVFSLARHPKELKIAACLEKNEIRLFDPTGKELYKLEPPGVPRTATWSPDGKRLAVITTQRKFLMYEGEKEIWQTEIGEATTWSTAWSRDGETIFVARGNQILKRSAKDGSPILAGGKTRQRVALDPSGIFRSKKVPGEFGVFSSLGLHKYSREKGDYLNVSMDDEKLRAASVSPDGSIIAFGESKSTHLLDGVTHKKITTLPVPKYTTEGLIFLRAGRLVRIMDDSFQVWDVEKPATPKLVSDHVIRNHYVPGTVLAGGLQFSYGLHDSTRDIGTLVIMGETGEQVQRMEIEQEYIRLISGNARSVFVYAEGASKKDPTLYLWRAPEPPEPLAKDELEKRLDELGAATFKVRKAAVRRLALGGAGTADRLRECMNAEDPEVAFRAEEALNLLAKNGQLIKKPITLPVDQPCKQLRMHPDGRHWFAIMGVGANSVILVGEFADGKLAILRTLEDGRGPARMTLNKDGSEIVAVNCDGSVTTWGVQE